MAKVARENFREFCKKLGLQQWNELGPLVLLDLKIDTNETIVQSVCNHLKIDHYDNFLELIDSTNVRISQFRQFVFTGQCTPLHQCIQDFRENEKLVAILKHFIHLNVVGDPNDYINKDKTTFLHMLIEKKQFQLLDKFINKFKYRLDFFAKDHLNKTPIMAALESGNKRVIKLVYDNVKHKLNRKDLIRIKEYIDALNQSIGERNNFLTAVLQNKLVVTSRPTVKETVHCMKNQFTAEIDGRSADFLWLYYVEKFKIPLSQMDKLTWNVYKQVLITRITKQLAEKYTFVMLIVNNFEGHFECLGNFLKFLPYNFKVVFVSPKRPPNKFHFYTIN